MRRMMFLEIMGLAHLEEDEETKQMDKEEGMKEKRKEKEKLHCLKIPRSETVTPQKRKVSKKKPSTRKKMRASKPQLEAKLMKDDISLVHGAMEDASKDIL
jgi:hypothetical protein